MSTGTNPVGKGRLALTAAIVVGAAIGGWVAPAGAGDSGDPGVRSLCSEVAQDPPQGGATLTTDPSQGAPLRAGQTVAVTLRWDGAAFAGGSLGRVVHCVVTLDGRLRLDLSGGEAPSPNDGVYNGSFTVPADLAPGGCLCVLGVASGDGGDGYPLRLGDGSCITVTAPPPRTPATIPPARPATVLPSRETAPPAAPLVPAVQTRPEPLRELPRTGPFDPRALLALAGLALVVGGGAVTARR